ncbi:MAG: S-layer homology domain-containing protein [Clostridia bacterium]|nr:S-layer homology domain-containing protein [Clostridia bacterium]
MKKMKRWMALLLGIVLCVGMISVGAAAKESLDWSDAYIAAYDEDGDPFKSVYAEGTTFTYYLKLFVWDTDSERYVAQEIRDTDAVTLYDENVGEQEVLAQGTGRVIRWTADKEGYCAVGIKLARGNQLFYGLEVYQIGDVYEMEWAEVLFEGNYVVDTLLYDGKSFLNRLTVYHYPSNTFLRKGVDYNIKMSKSKGPGKSVITVTGLGKCEGKLVIDVDIVSPSARFSDVNQKKWYVGAVNFALESKLLSGVSKTAFDPDGHMTRAMFVTVIGRLLGLGELPDIGHPFIDVENGRYYTKYVAWATALDIIRGTSNSTFSPDAYITREQVCTIIDRMTDFYSDMLDELGYDDDIELESDGGMRFFDHMSISSWARESVYGCRNAGIVSGKPNNIFDPQGNASRAEVATIMKNYVYFLSDNIAVL